MGKKKKKIKKLQVILKKNSGRNNEGKITVRHQGGRHKRYYRIIDFKREPNSEKGIVVDIQRDPNRSSMIALIKYQNGDFRYILHPQGLAIGDTVECGPDVDIKVGNCLPLKNIPLGKEIHNIELYPGDGGKLVRSAGSAAVIVAKDEKYAEIKMPSKEIRKVLLTCYATIGRVSNIEHKVKKLMKAGRSIHLGIRPTVRGVAQNPRSHPHGGGEGRSGEGMHPKTVYGKQARGKKTRKNKRTDKFIVRSRNSIR